MIPARPKYCRAVKRRERAFMYSINIKAEPLEETPRDMPAFFKHPGMSPGDDDEPIKNTRDPLEDKGVYFMGFGLSETSTAEAECLQTQPDGRVTPGLIDIANTYQSQPAPPSTFPKRDPGGRTTPDPFRAPGDYFGRGSPPDFPRSTTPPGDPDGRASIYLDGSRYQSQDVPRSTTPEGYPKRESSPRNSAPNVQHSRQIQPEHRTCVQNPRRRSRLSAFDRGYTSNSTHGSANHPISAPSWRLSNTSDITITSPFEPRDDGSPPSRLFGPLESLFQAWSTSQSRQPSTSSNCHHDSETNDHSTPSSSWLNPVQQLSSALWNGNERETDTDNGEKINTGNENETPLSISLKKRQSMGQIPRSFGREDAPRKRASSVEFANGGTVHQQAIEAYPTNINNTQGTTSFKEHSSYVRGSGIDSELIESTTNERNHFLERHGIEEGEFMRASPSCSNMPEREDSYSAASDIPQPPETTRTETETEYFTQMSASPLDNEENSHGVRMDQPFLGRLNPPNLVTRITSRENDVMYEVELNPDNSSNNSGDEDWVAVSSRVEDEAAVIFANRLFSYIDRWGGSPRADFLELAMQRLGPQRVVDTISRLTQTEQLTAGRNQEQEGQQVEMDGVDDAEEAWVAVSEMED